MGTDTEHPPEEAGKLPTGRVARTARVGGLVTGQGVRWAGMRAANRVRTPERAEAAERRAHHRARQRARRPARPDARRGDEGRADALDGRLRRPPRTSSRTSCSASSPPCATASPPVPFDRLREAPAQGARRAARATCSRSSTSARSPPPRSARSTARRRSTATTSRSRSSTRASPRRSRPTCATRCCCCRWSSGWPRAWTPRRWRRRCASASAEELDYELEAQNQRRIARLVRGHPFVSVPRGPHGPLDPARAGHRVRRGRAIRGRPPRGRSRRATATARSSSASSSACSTATGSRSATRTRATTCCAPTGASCFLDFGLLRDIDRDRVAAEAAIAHAVARRGMPRALKAALVAGGYLPADRADAVDAELALRLMRRAIRWYAVPGERRFSTERGRARPQRRAARTPSSGPRSATRSTSSRCRPESDAHPADARASSRSCCTACAPAPTGARSRPSTCTASRRRRRSGEAEADWLRSRGRA